MRQIRNTSVMEALSDDARAYGIKRLAPELDKEPSSLYAELNPYGDQSKAKHSFDDAIETMRVIQKFTALELAAATLGFRLVPIDVVPDRQTVAEELTDDVRKLGTFAEVCSRQDVSEAEVNLAADELHHEVDETRALKLAEIAALKKRL